MNRERSSRYGAPRNIHGVLLGEHVMMGIKAGARGNAHLFIPTQLRAV